MPKCTQKCQQNFFFRLWMANYREIKSIFGKFHPQKYQPTDNGSFKNKNYHISTICFEYLWFHSIWYATWPFSEKVEFWHFDHTRRSGTMRKMFANMLLRASFPLIWYATCPYSHKLKFDLHPGGLTQAFDLQSHSICFIFIVPLSECEISVNLTELLRKLDIWPIQRGQGVGVKF